MSVKYKDRQLGFQQGELFIPFSEIIEDHEDAFYAYDLNEMINRYQTLKDSFGQQVSVHYAVKSNSHKKLLRSLAQAGAGADVVSGGELRTALACGISADKIVFSGVAKTHEEIQLAIDENILQINVESPAELNRISQIAKAKQKKASVAFRMNPDVNPETHPYIKTGFRENKFGMDESFLPELIEICQNNEYLELKGITLHIGSQIRDLSPIYEAVQKSVKVYESLKRKGFPLSTFDVGGGVGIDYHSMDGSQEYESMKEYGQKIAKILNPLSTQILIEPGRVISARGGVLLTKVEYVKQTPFKNFLIVNTGMHHLMRPCLYQAYHNILPVNQSQETTQMRYDIVGPICESSDVLGHDRTLPEMKEGDWLAVLDAGAYGFAMANNYNEHGLPQEVVVSNGKII